MSFTHDAVSSTCDSAVGLQALGCAMKLPLEPSYWLIQGVALTITAFILPGLRVTSLFGPILMLVSITVVNAFLWDASLFYNIPHSLTNQAVMVMLWNAVIFWILVKLLPGIEISGFVAPILAPIIFTATTLFASQYATKVDWEKLANGIVDEVHEQRNVLKKPVEKSQKTSVDTLRSEKF